MSVPTKYPDEWKTTLQAAQSQAKFTIDLPSDPLANTGNITAVYVWPQGAAVALDFPAPAVPQTPVRQDYIEVWESPWTGGDPAQSFAADIAADPVVGKAMYSIDGMPALGVTAHSPNDFERANAAFLRFVVNGVDVQISGGEDRGSPGGSATSSGAFTNTHLWTTTRAFVEREPACGDRADRAPLIGPSGMSPNDWTSLVRLAA